ncbi:hypothetical protein P5V15_003340 [Pogonomyrmex californicus]
MVENIFVKCSRYIVVMCMPACDAKRKAKRKFTADRIAWSFGASAIIRSITAVCRFGLNRTIVVHCVSKSGPFNEWENNLYNSIGSIFFLICYKNVYVLYVTKLLFIIKQLIKIILFYFNILIFYSDSLL